MQPVNRISFGVLGPVELLADGEPVPLGPAKQRAVLAILLLRANRTVSVDELVDLLWAEEPPRTARKNIQVYVWRLRRIVGARLQSCSPGYRFAVGPDGLDLTRFEALLGSARAARGNRWLPEAAVHYRAALELWRGAPLADLAGIGRLGVAAARLDRRRLLAHEEQIDVELELGRHGAVLSTLDELVAAHPLHERFAEQHILALYRAGRRADAVEAYLRCRRTLARELGVEPGPALQRLAGLVRDGDPAIASRSAARRPSARAEASASIAPRQLPSTVGTFTGRDRELAELRERLTATREPAIAVCVVTGRPGVGKSALAVHVGHLLAEAFPDGQLYVDLHGATAGLRPALPVDVLGRFLRVLGVPQQSVPAHVDEASARLRSLLVDRRLLVVLDNAYDAGQVRPLIPAGTRCAVLVTARRSLADLDGASQIELGGLTADAAVTLLGRLAGRARVAAEPGAAAELVRWSAGLPLALRIAGARLAVRPQWSIATLAGRLRDERHRLRELRLGDLAVRTSFLVSYEHLVDPLARRLFRLLGAVDGPDVTPPAAAALLDASLAEARDALDELVDARLMDESASNRYRMHDLIRLFARERVDAEESPEQRDTALRRVLDHYLHLTVHAVYLDHPGTRAATPDRPSAFADRDEAAAWLAAERVNLVAAVVRSAGTSDETLARCGIELADALFPFLEARGLLEDWVAMDRAAIDAARRFGERGAEARLLNDLATAHFYRHRVDDAIVALRRSLELGRESGDDEAQARALNQLGILHGEAGEFNLSIEYLKDSQRLHERTGNARACASAMGNIGTAYRLAGEHEEAIRFCRAAARLARRCGLPETEANALGNLAEVQCLLGRYESALRYLRRSIAVRGQAGNERNLGSTMGTIAEAYLGAGRIGPAIRHAELSVEAFRRAGFRHGEALALRRLGRMLHEHGDARRGAAELRCALDLFTALGGDEAAEVRAELSNLDHTAVV